MLTRFAAVVISSALVTGCRSSDGATGTTPDSAEAKEPATMKLTSAAFDDHQPMDAKYTCEGQDISPPLAWSPVPEGTKSLALIVDDPDAPDPAAPKRIFTHWVLFDIPANATMLPEDASAVGLPSGTRVGKNDWHRMDYGGPCPPIGRHRYFHRIYALDVELKGLEAPTRAELLAAMKGHVVGQAELVGTYQKTR